MAGTSLQTRAQILQASQQGLTDPQIAEQLQLALATVRKWRRKGQRAGDEGLYSQMGRPKRGSLSTFSAPVAEQLWCWRQGHPGWGPTTLLAELQRQGNYQQGDLPSLATIARWLKEQGFSQPYEKHEELPRLPLSSALACHEEWEMDGRGHELIPNLGMVSLIQVNDVFSKVKLISYPCWLGEKRLVRYPDTEDYQLVLRLAFSQWGLPERLAVDRARVFYDAQGKSPFPTRFHLWLLALGVSLTFGRPGQPRDQALTERSHQTWWKQVVQGQTFSVLRQLFHALQERRSFLNEHLPCATLGHLPPLVVHPEAETPVRPYRPEWEADLLDLQRVYEYLGQCHWFRRVSKVGTASLGRHNYTLGKDWYNCETEVRFDPSDHTFIFHAPPRTDKRLPIRWLTKETLMGEADAILHLPEFQLQLPFSREAIRQLEIRTLLR